MVHSERHARARPVERLECHRHGVGKATRRRFVFGALWGAGYLAWKQDPNMLAILKASTRFKARYDPGKWIAEPWRVILKGRYE